MGRHTVEIDLNESAKGEKVEKDPFGIADDVEIDEVRWSGKEFSSNVILCKI